MKTLLTFPEENSRWKVFILLWIPRQNIIWLAAMFGPKPNMLNMSLYSHALCFFSNAYPL